jgi:hypothetical protein
MPVLRNQFDDLLVPGARKVYIDDYAELPAIYPSLFMIDTSGRAFEDDLVMTGLPAAVEKPEGEPIAFDRPKFRGKVRYIHSGFGLGYEITREAVDDDLYGALNSQGAANLARSMRETEEITAHAVLNGAFTTIEGYDGVSLVNTAHPGVGGVTNTNRPGSDEDVSVAALKANSERYMNLTTDRGLKISVQPSILLTAIGGWYAALEILQTQFRTLDTTGGDPLDSTYGVNVAMSSKMGLTPMKSQYLTDDDMWLTLTPKGSRSYPLKFYWRVKPEDASGTDLRAKVAWYAIYARMSAGATTWRGLDGSTGA